MRMLPQEEESDDAAEVTWEDQQRINSFSKLNTRVRSLEEKLQELKQEKEALDDLSTELELADEDQPVLCATILPFILHNLMLSRRYKVGEAFLHLPLPRALKRLEKDQATIDARITTLAASAEGCEVEMKELKVTLYAKFGRAINLDD
ncbi:hypothetical protein H0H81_007649 [Sphagnurus paluster]|uniref:Prefoldin subunit 4 n=1 Tax=Sphagnurus paluster TaxID=117069 RepID=A0A9P7FXK0_9AGAR|nr:hypothetical protein H0H81_007649 [Sphagnurus paluster]